MLDNLAMGFDVYDARVRRGGGPSRYRRCFQIKRSLYGSPHRGFTTPSASRASRTDRREGVVISEHAKLRVKL